MSRRQPPRRPIILAPFRGVPALRRQTEQVMARETQRMREEVERAMRGESMSAATRALRLESIFSKWTDRFNELARELAWRVMNDSTRKGREHFTSEAGKALGIPAVAVFETEQMRRALEDASVAAATYIKTIPGQYVGKVAAAMAQNIRGEPLPGDVSLPEFIRSIGFSTKKRARFMARDQFHKITSTIVEVQAKGIGSDGYLWQTAQDERVVGNPSGLHPKGGPQHGDHYHRQGKFYKWSQPPADGNPGQPIGCRCFARVVISDVKKLLGRA